MHLKNRILVILCTVVVTVSFLYPFPGRNVYAKPEVTASEDSEEEMIQTASEADETTQKETETKTKRAAGHMAIKEKESEAAVQEENTRREKIDAQRESERDNAEEDEPATKELEEKIEETDEADTAEKSMEKNESEQDEERQEEKSAESDSLEEIQAENEKETEHAEETKNIKEETIAETTESRKEETIAEETESVKEETIAERKENTKEETIAEGEENTKEETIAEAAENRKEETTAEEAAPCVVENDTQDTEAEKSLTAESAGTYAFRRALAAPGRGAGISAEAPRAGQQNRYDNNGSETTWTVPADGYYDLYCYGAQGGRGAYEGKSGSAGDGKNGDAIGRRYFMKKGTVLSIQVGNQPQQSVASDFGEGSSNGNPKEITDYGYSRRVWKHRKDSDYGVGTIWQYRGYPDGDYGNYQMTICNNNGNHSGGAAGGGGGGSTRIWIGSSLLMSAKGGNGGSASYVTYNDDGFGTTDGGVCSGATSASSLANASLQNGLNFSDSNSGNGYAVIRVVSINPAVALETDQTEWTNKKVTLRASTKNNVSELPTQYLSWEKEENGNEVWTDRATFAVFQNGAYQCVIRNTTGNTSKASVIVKNIDRLEPFVKQEKSVSGWTKEAVTLTVLAEDAPASAEDGCSGLPQNAYSWQEDENGDALWSGENTYTVSENGTFTCQVRDNAGNITETDFSVSEIDTTPPEVTCNRPEAWYEGSAVIQIKAEDLQPDGTPGCGLAEEAYSTDGIHFTEKPEFLIPEAGTYTVWVKDAVGNIREESFSFTYDEKEGMEEETETEEKKTEETETEKTETKETEAEETKTEETKKKSKKRGKESSVSLVQSLKEMIEEKKEETVRLEDTKIPEIKEMATYAEIKKPDRKEEFQIVPEGITEPDKPEGGGSIQKEEQAVKETEPEKAVLLQQKPEKRSPNWKKTVILYSAWIAVVLCGLLWLLFSLLMEHAAVYMRNEKGKYRKIGLCLIIRKKDYKQVNLTALMRVGEQRDYKIRFSPLFVFLHKNERLLIRTDSGVELRNIAKEIEIFSCNS